MLAQRVPGRVALDAAGLGHGFLEHHRLVDAQPHVQADQDEQEAGQEREPPAPGHQLIVRQHGHQREGRGGEQVAHRHAERGEAAPETALPVRRALHEVDDGAAILGPRPQSLHHAQRYQHQRRPEPGGRVGRQQADRRRADPDHQQRGDQHRLAAVPVAHDAEHDAAERPHEESHAEGQERQQRADHRVGFREEQLAEHQRRRGAIQEEVVPLERRADRGRQDDAPVDRPRADRGAAWHGGAHWRVPSPGCSWFRRREGVRRRVRNTSFAKPTASRRSSPGGSPAAAACAPARAPAAARSPCRRSAGGC